MSSFRQRSYFAGLAAAIALCATSAEAATSIVATPASGHPALSVGVNGSGFGASEAIDVYFDTTDEMLVVSNSAGAFTKHAFNVPANAQPGQHWITAIGRHSGNAFQRAFTVSTMWAAHGFDTRGRRNNPFENTIGVSNVGTSDVAWQYLTGGQIFSSPAYSNGVVYIGSDDAKLYAIT